MDEGFLGNSEILVARPAVSALAVVAQVDMVPPEPLQQLVIGPAVVGVCHACRGFITPPAFQPEAR